MENKSFGVIGNPITHSKSPLIHNLWYSKLNINANYEKIFVENKEDLKSAILNKNGVNITLPYKEEAVKISNYLSDEVKIIKAANTIINDNGILKAFNTDVFGFYEPIKKYNFKNALIIGAGGAARACFYALSKQNIPTIVINRSEKNDFLTKVHTKLNDFNFDLIVNSTSASLKDELPLNEDTLNKLSKNAKLVYDLAYSHDIFLDFFKNVIKQDGLDMLVYQAALAFKHFCEIYPSDELIQNAKELIK